MNTPTPPSPVAPQCVDCIYFRLGNPALGYGDCHRYPPLGHPSVTAFAWPPVQPDDFCGEFVVIVP